MTRRVLSVGAQPGPQSDALSATWCRELLYGGARGGGKSFFLLLDFAQDAHRYGGDWHGILFRRTYPELEQLISDSYRIYPYLGAEFKASASARLWQFPGGATLRFRSLDRSSDFMRYQGHAYPWLGWDELGLWSTDEAYRACLAINRPRGPTPVRVRSTSNPQGPGHHWVKSYFVDPHPEGYIPFRNPDTGHDVLYIPAKVWDNKILLKNMPNYVDSLRGTGSPELVRAWLDGDWNVISGAFFSEFNPEYHVVTPFPIPNYWPKMRGVDWGYSRPSATLWCATSDGTVPGVGRGDVVVYREYYTAEKPNVGQRLDAEQVGRAIAAYSGDEKYVFSVADSAIFSRDGAMSIAEILARSGSYFVPSSKGRGSRISGWNVLRSYLNTEDGRPKLRVFSTCKNLIRTLQSVQHDTTNAEDLDTDGEDHLADALRYIMTARVYGAVDPPVEKPVIDTRPPTVSQLFVTPDGGSW